MTSDFCQNIVIATDGSENSLKAISYGIKLAKLSGATIYALHVVDTYSLSQSWTAGRETMYENLKEDGQKATLKVKEYAEATGVEVKEVLLEGHPSKEIIDFAEKNNIDMTLPSSRSLAASMEPVFERVDKLDAVADDLLNSLSPSKPLLNSWPGRENTSYMAGIYSNAFYGVVVGLAFSGLLALIIYIKRIMEGGV